MRTFEATPEVVRVGDVVVVSEEDEALAQTNGVLSHIVAVDRVSAAKADEPTIDAETLVETSLVVSVEVV